MLNLSENCFKDFYYLIVNVHVALYAKVHTHIDNCLNTICILGIYEISV